jgi:asparagine synthase (glutamine-hydrolysing)
VGEPTDNVVPGWRAVRLAGFSSWSAGTILEQASRGVPVHAMPGDFVVCGERGAGEDRETVIVSSMVAATPYYYAPEVAHAHGDNVFSLARDLRLPWSWNERALRCLALVGHTVGDDTLHPAIRRVPGCCVLRCRFARWFIETSPFWQEPKKEAGSLEEALAAFEAVLDELVLSDRPLVALSAGYDSRALLSRLVASGRKPVVATMGSSNATDVVVAAAIASSLGLEHHRFEIEPADYLRYAEEISSLTSGVKTGQNWHTFLYSRRAGDLGCTKHVVGSNGEFARTFYLDAGLLALSSKALPSAAVTAYWTARLLRRRSRFPFRFDFLANEPSASISLAANLGRLSSGPGGLLDALDRFYVTQRVRHFIGAGLKLYSAHTHPVSPFLDARWIRPVARLARRWKLGSRYHREVIARNCSELLKFPTVGTSPMGRHARPGYWLRKGSAVGYSPYATVLKSSALRDIVLERGPLDRFMARPDREAAWKASHHDTLDLLLTLHFAARSAVSASG